MIELKSVKTKDSKRIGRGISAGGGKTAGRGMKGQKSRAGHNIPKRFEGGQTPLSMRLARLRGNRSHSIIYRSPKAVILSLDLISAKFKDGELVSMQSLIEKKIVEKNAKVVKILNNGKLTVKVSIAPEIRASKGIQNLFAEPAVEEPKAKTAAEAKEPKKATEIKATKKPATKKESK